MRTVIRSALLLTCLAPTILRAQALRGRVLAADSAAVPGAIVALVDTGGTVVARVLTSSLGSYIVRAPKEGTYALRVYRIGFAAFKGPPLQLADAGSVDYSPLLPDDPIVLNDIEITAGGGCRSDERVAGNTATLLEEVRKAFGAADLALRDHDLRFEVLWKVKRWGLRVEHSQDSVSEMLRSWPIHSLPAEQLRDRGFVQPADSVDPAYVPLGAQGRVWFGPDPTTLFSAPFLATHCYRLVTDGHDADLVGLRFAPVPGRRLMEIRGTLWLRRRTLGLEKIEYEYVNIPDYLTRGVTERARGTMDLLKLPSGLWIVRSWSLRAPVEYARDGVPVGVAGWLEQSGAITAIRTSQGAVIF